MTQDEFDQVVRERQEKIVSVLGKKAAEYARGDRLSNFKQAAAAMRCTPAQALMSMWMKHVVSICDMVNDQAAQIKHSPEMWNEKIGDAINYLVLLEALVKEQQ